MNTNVFFVHEQHPPLQPYQDWTAWLWVACTPYFLYQLVVCWWTLDETLPRKQVKSRYRWMYCAFIMTINIFSSTYRLVKYICPLSSWLLQVNRSGWTIFSQVLQNFFVLLKMTSGLLTPSRLVPVYTTVVISILLTTSWINAKQSLYLCCFGSLIDLSGAIVLDVVDSRAEDCCSTGANTSCESVLQVDSTEWSGFSFTFSSSGGHVSGFLDLFLFISRVVWSNMHLSVPSLSTKVSINLTKLNYI